MTTDRLGFLARQGVMVGSILDQLAGAEQHQAVHQNARAGRCRGAVDLVLVQRLGIHQVPGQGGYVAGGAGNQDVQGGTPGIHGMGDQVDLFDRQLRLGHESGPHAAAAVEAFRPSATAI
ncbi:hypothetical protein B6S59_25315 [Pseudomonas sp. A46]|nr:hypothetical protein [Pseudomonas sp. A46]OWJ91094.1 hypothetical protein B6S59_25315 [Pseudomonas sp. A46]